MTISTMSLLLRRIQIFFSLSFCFFLKTASLSVASSTATTEATTDDSPSYIFLQKFPLQNSFGKLFHTEVLVCPKAGFDADDQKYLDGTIADLKDFEEIPIDWWTTRTANCMEFGYGGAACTSRCCGVPHKDRELKFPLNERRAVIGNADTTDKTLFLYGEAAQAGSGEDAYQTLCNPHHTKCWSDWAGTDYNPLTNNCNTFTSTVLHCIYGLSESKPNLGPSDMVTVTCDQCPKQIQSPEHGFKLFEDPQLEIS